MLTEIEKSPCENNPIRAKGRREKTDRRQKAKKLMTQLDRRNVQDRRDIKDRRFSKQKTFLFPVAQQGISIKALNSEKEKLTKLIDKIISTGESKLYLSLTDLLKEAYFSLHSQESKEKVLYQWYQETIKHSERNSEDATLVAQLNFILEQEMGDIIAIMDKYLSLKVDLDENRESFIQDMQCVQEALMACTLKKRKYIYPHYQDMLSLS